MKRPEPSMSDDWDLRAKEDPTFYIATDRKSWELPEFFEHGALLANDLLHPALDRLGFAPQGKRILEIGCGIGRLFPGFAHVFGEIWGIDVSPEMVRRGSESCPVSDSKFIVGNGNDLDGIEDASVDYCFSYQVFQHVPDLAVLWSYLNEIHRVLRPGGGFQLHFRRKTGLRARIFYILPGGSLRHLAHLLYASVLNWWPRGRSIYHAIPGDLSTWIGSTVRPEEVSTKLIDLGFLNVQTFRDSYEPSSLKFWAIGRKS